MDFEKMLKGKKYKSNTDMREYWNYRSKGFNKMAQRNRVTDDTFLGKVISEKKILDKSSTVLDVGCGVGRHLLYFADKVDSVVGVDISDQMLEFARENLVDNDNNNFELYTMDWNSNDNPLGKDRKFDLVFASMSAALIDKKSIEKFTHFSKNYCLVERFLGQTDSFKELLGEILGRNMENSAHNNDEYTRGLYNLVFDMGYYPEVFVDSTRETEIIKISEIERHYSRIFESLEELELKKVRKYLNSQKSEEIAIKREIVKSLILWNIDIRR